MYQCRCHFYLVKRGCNVAVTSTLYEKNTLLHKVCQMKHPELLKLLMRNPHFDVEVKNGSGSRPIHIACKFPHVDVITSLVIDGHCDVNARDGSNNTPLHFACERFDVVKIVGDHPQCNTADAENNFQERPIHSACKSGSYDIAYYLVTEKNCSINQRRQFIMSADLEM